MDWFILDMDDGVLRRESTRKAAVEWLKDHHDAPRVVERHTYGPGAYKYVVGSSDPYDRGGAFIERADVAGREGGWKIDQTPLYPHADYPHERVEREES